MSYIDAIRQVSSQFTHEISDAEAITLVGEVATCLVQILLVCMLGLLGIAPMMV